MKYSLTHAALAVTLLSGCSVVDGTTSAVSSAVGASVTGVKRVTGIFSRDKDETVAAPEQYLAMREAPLRSDTGIQLPAAAAVTPPRDYANGIQAAAAAIEAGQRHAAGVQPVSASSSHTAMSSMLTSLVMQKDMIESDNINASFTPLYQQFGVLPDIIDAHTGLLLERGRYADVMQLVEGAWTQGARVTPEILNAAGMAAFARNDHAGALRFFTEALNLDAADVKTVNNIAVLYLAQQRPQEALQILSALPIRSVQDRQHAERVSFNKALANALIGNLPESERLLRMTMAPSDVSANMAYFKTLQANPNASNFYLNRAMGLSAGQRPGVGDTSLRLPSQPTPSRTASASYASDGFGVRQVYERTASYESAPLHRAAYVQPEPQPMYHRQPAMQQQGNGVMHVAAVDAQPSYAERTAYVPSEDKDPAQIFSPDNFYTYPSLPERALEQGIQGQQPLSEDEWQQARPYVQEQAQPRRQPSYRQQQAVYNGTPVYVVPDAPPAPQPDIVAYADSYEEEALPVDESYVPEENAGYIMPNAMPTESDYSSEEDDYATYEERESYDETDFRSDEEISYEQPAEPSYEAQAPAAQPDRDVFDDGQLAAFAAAVDEPVAAAPQENAAYITPERSSLPYKRYAVPAQPQPAAEQQQQQKRYYVVEESAADERVMRPY